MLKLTVRRFAVSCVAAGAFAGATAYAQTPGITPGDSQPAPRRSNPSTGDTVPELDSRTGAGEFARDVTTRGADVGDDLHERTTFAGVVTGVSDGRLSVQMSPPRVPTAMEQVFRMTKDTPVVVNGEPGTLADIRRDSLVRVVTFAADPETAAKVIVAGPTSAGRRAAADDEPERTRPRRPVASVPAVDPEPQLTDEDTDRNFDVYPSAKSPPTPPDAYDEEQPGGPDMNRMAAQGAEEAVLPLGVEVYGGGNQGALVTEMLAGGPAATAGVLINDLIVAVNGQTVSDPELIEAAMAANGGGSAELTLMRNGETLQVSVQPGQLVEGSLVTAGAMGQALVNAGLVGNGGLTFGGTLTDFRGGGVRIDGTEGALLGGLLPGDVITSFNGQPIRNRGQLMDVLGNLPANSQGFGLGVRRNGELVDLDVPLSALGTDFVNGTGFGNQGLGNQGFTNGGQGFAGQNGFNDGFNGNGGVNGGQTGVGPSQNAVGPGLMPRSPGRSDASQAGPGLGRSDARLGGAGLGRSQAAPGNNQGAQNGVGVQNGTGVQNGAGVQNGGGVQNGAAGTQTQIQTQTGGANGVVGGAGGAATGAAVGGAAAGAAATGGAATGGATGGTGGTQ